MSDAQPKWRLFTVRIHGEAFERLLDVAVQERRAPRDQAAILLEAALFPEGIDLALDGKDGATS